MVSARPFPTLGIEANSLWLASVSFTIVGYAFNTSRVGSLKELNKILTREDAAKTLMNLSRECARLEALDLIRSIRTRKLKTIFTTSFGKQYSEFQNYDKPSLQIVWERK